MEGLILEVVFAEAVYAAKNYFIFSAAAFFLFYVLFGKLLKHRKIQSRSSEIKEWLREIGFSLSSVLIFGTVAALTFHVSAQSTNIYWGNNDKYGEVYYFLSFIWVMFLHDTYFYWMHRLMHTPKLYQFVHKTHHRSTNPSP